MKAASKRRFQKSKRWGRPVLGILSGACSGERFVVVGGFDLIHSVNSVELAEEIDGGRRKRG